MDSVGHRQLRLESTLAFSGQAARFRPRPIEPHEIDGSPNCKRPPNSGSDEGCGQRLSLSANRSGNRPSADEPHTTKRHQAAKGTEHHGQSNPTMERPRKYFTGSSWHS